MQTKIVIGLCVAQLVLLVLVYSELAGIRERPQVRLPASSGPVANPAPAAFGAAAPPPAATVYPDDDRLRRIIREELTSVLQGRYAPSMEQQQSQPASPSADPAAAEQRRQEVAAQLEYHASVGRISAADMQQLQNDIASLDEPARTEMLRELIRALNAGRLEGRL